MILCVAHIQTPFFSVGIYQDMLETVIPKPPSDQVMIVAGKRKGQVSNISVTE